MVLKEDQEELRSLLVDVIPVLCKERLKYSFNFRVDAVIGVTVDNNEHFYISLNDTVRLDKESPVSEEAGWIPSGSDSPTLEMCVYADNRDELSDSDIKLTIKEEDFSMRSFENDNSLNDSSTTRKSSEFKPKPRRGRKRKSKTGSSTPSKKSTQKQTHSDPVHEISTVTSKTDCTPSNILTQKETYSEYLPGISTVTSEADLSNSRLAEGAELENDDNNDDGDPGWSSNADDEHPNESDDKQQHTRPISERSVTQRSLLSSKDGSFDQEIPEEMDDKMLSSCDVAGRLSKQNSIRIYRCKDCSKTFSNSSHLTRHQRLHTGTMFTCDYCDKKYYEKSQLATHVRNVHVIGKLQCDRCPKQFESEQGLKTHILWHDGDFRFQCDYCGHKFLSGAAYKTHINQHEGITPYKCDICEKGFTSTSSRKRHAETCCSSVRLHICGVCGKGYKTEKYLKEHMQSHNTESKSVCNICGKSYTFKCTLAEHRKKHHPNMAT